MTSRVHAYLERLARVPEADSRIWYDPAGRVVGRFMRCQLASVFQPVFDLREQKPVAREAFVRSCHSVDSSLSPWSLFALAAGDDDLVALDRLCRTVHALNHFSSAVADELLVVNVHGRLLSVVTEDHGHAFRRVLEALALSPRQVVIETPESAASDPALLAFVMSNYRLNGFHVSISAAVPAQVETLLAHLRPDYLKLDARRFSSSDEVREVLDHAIRSGVELIFQRVETVEQLLRLRSAGARYLQGNLLGRAAVVSANIQPAA